MVQLLHLIVLSNYPLLLLLPPPPPSLPSSSLPRLSFLPGHSPPPLTSSLVPYSFLSYPSTPRLRLPFFHQLLVPTSFPAPQSPPTWARLPLPHPLPPPTRHFLRLPPIPVPANHIRVTLCPHLLLLLQPCAVIWTHHIPKQSTCKTHRQQHNTVNHPNKLPRIAL